MIDPIEVVMILKFVLRNEGLKAQIFKQHSLLPYFSFKNVYSKKSKKPLCLISINVLKKLIRLSP